MKNLWKGVKKVMKVATDKVENAVNSVFADNAKARKLGLLIIGLGVGLGGGLVAMSYVNI